MIPLTVAASITICAIQYYRSLAKHKSLQHLNATKEETLSFLLEQKITWSQAHEEIYQQPLLSSKEKQTLSLLLLAELYNQKYQSGIAATFIQTINLSKELENKKITPPIQYHPNFISIFQNNEISEIIFQKNKPIFNKIALFNDQINRIKHCGSSMHNGFIYCIQQEGELSIYKKIISKKTTQWILFFKHTISKESIQLTACCPSGDMYLILDTNNLLQLYTIKQRNNCSLLLKISLNTICHTNNLVEKIGINDFGIITLVLNNKDHKLLTFYNYSIKTKTFTWISELPYKNNITHSFLDTQQQLFAFYDQAAIMVYTIYKKQITDSCRIQKEQIQSISTLFIDQKNLYVIYNNNQIDTWHCDFDPQLAAYKAFYLLTKACPYQKSKIIIEALGNHLQASSSKTLERLERVGINQKLEKNINDLLSRLYL